jgi:hypothetical protein
MSKNLAARLAVMEANLPRPDSHSIPAELTGLSATELVSRCYEMMATYQSTPDAIALSTWLGQQPATELVRMYRGVLRGGRIEIPSNH